MDVLPKRMSKYGLTVHPEKTRLIRFHPDPRRLRAAGRRFLAAADIRLSGLHPLLGPGSERRMGNKAQDGQEPPQASISSAIGMVSSQIGIDRSRFNTRR